MRRILALFLLLAPLSAAEFKPEGHEFRGTRYHVLRLDPAKLELVWKGADGQPLRTFDRVREDVEGRGRMLRFVMNAGIFEPGGIPSGLHVEGGKVLSPLNAREGEGNFYLQPNGVFGITAEGRARVRPTSKARVADFVLAIQSGPLLLADGVRHAAFREGSPNTKHRNGVGVDAEGQVVLAMTEWGQVTNFWDFAGLFLELGCRDALFLDGDISQIAVDPRPGVRSNRFGAMFVVSEPK